MKKWWSVNTVSTDQQVELVLVIDGYKIVQLCDSNREHESSDNANHGIVAWSNLFRGTPIECVINKKHMMILANMWRRPVTKKVQHWGGRTGFVSLCMIRFHDTGMVAIAELWNYKESINVNEKYEWNYALKYELNSIEFNNTWVKANVPYEEASHPLQNNIKNKFGWKWTYMKIQSATGSISVCTKTKGSPYGKNGFCSTIRILLLITRRLISEGWYKQHLDHFTVNFDGRIGSELYAKWDCKTLRLLNSSYWLKTFSLLCLETSKETVKRFCFIQLVLFGCVFMIEKWKFKRIFIVYVDDVVILWNELYRVIQTRSEINSILKLANLETALILYGGFRT